MIFRHAGFPLILMRAVDVQTLLKERLFGYPGMNEDAWLSDGNCLKILRNNRNFFIECCTSLIRVSGSERLLISTAHRKESAFAYNMTVPEVEIDYCLTTKVKKM